MSKDPTCLIPEPHDKVRLGDADVGFRNYIIVFATLSLLCIAALLLAALNDVWG